MKNKMKIALVIPQMPPEYIGGAELQTQKMAELFAKDHDVTIVTEKGGKQSNKYKLVKTKNINIPVLRTIFYILNTKKILKKLKPEIIISHQLQFSSLAAILAKKEIKAKVITRIHGEKSFKKNSFIRKLLINYSINNSDLILIQSKILKNQFLKLFPKANIKILPNGIDIPKKISKGNKILYVGRISKDRETDKGVEYLVKAVKDLDIETIIVGDGNQRKKLEKLTKETRIKFIGKVPHSEVEKYYLQAKVFVLPSLYEGTPDALSEAMSYGIPCIATNVGGIPDIIENEKTGLLIPPKNLNAIRKNVLRLFNNKKIHNKIAKNCRKRISKNTNEKIIKMINRILKEIIVKA